MRLLQALSHASIRVPNDIALIGFEDIDVAAAATVPLSSINQPARQLGEEAARLLLDEVNRG